MLRCCLEVAIVLNSLWSLGVLQVASIVFGIETSMMTVSNLQAYFGAFEDIFDIFNVSISVHVVLAHGLDIVPSFTETWKAALGLNRHFISGLWCLFTCPIHLVLVSMSLSMWPMSVKRVHWEVCASQTKNSQPRDCHLAQWAWQSAALYTGKTSSTTLVRKVFPLNQSLNQITTNRPSHG